MQEPPPAATPAVETCYRHPTEQTGVHCTRCGRPICPECMIPAPVGHQCPECVEAARKEFRRSTPQQRLKSVGRVSVTRAVLVILLAAYIVEIAAGGPNSLIGGPQPETLFDLGALFPDAVAAGQYWRLLSSTLLHAGLLHIGLNAYALWLFGSLVESAFGRLRFVLIYVVSAFAGSAASFAFGPRISLGVGASGAIVGVFGAFVAFNYRRRHMALAQAQLRSAVMIIIVNAVIGVTFPGIDWRAHLGGLIAGAAIGGALDSDRPGRSSTLLAVFGTAAVILASVLLVVWRTNQLQSTPLPLIG